MSDENKLEIVTVKSAATDGRVALWEKHAAHPDDGEAFVSSEAPVKVALTPEVQRLLSAGILVKVESTPLQSVKKLIGQGEK